jgi:hypothetical protein
VNGANGRLLVGFSALIVILTPHCAQATDSLRVGIIRDSEGYLVNDASITLFNAHGVAWPKLRSSLDGTFAFEAASQPLKILVTCAYCRELRTPYPASGIITVERYHNIQSVGPNSQDIKALPSRTLSQIVSLIPYAEQGAGTVSDRGLRRGADATLFNGINLYRQSDNAPISSIFQGITAGNVAMENHVFAVDAFPQETPQLRADSNGVVRIRTGGRTAGVYARNVNENENTIGFHGTSAVGQYTIHENAALANNRDGQLGGALLFAGRTFSSRTVNAEIRLTNSDYKGSAESDAVINMQTAGLSTNPLVIGFQGVRVRANGVISLPGSRNMDTMFGAYHFRLRNTRIMLGASANPSVQYEARVERSINSTMNLIAHYEEYPQTSPIINTFSPPRARLIEASVDIGDGHRARGQLMIYQETTADIARTVVRGFGTTISYQVAPRIALRSWLLRAIQSNRAQVNPFSWYVVDQSQHNNAQLLWLTYDNGFRFDLLYQQRRPEFSGSFRLGRWASLVAGSHMLNGHNAFTMEYISPH